TDSFIFSVSIIWCGRKALLPEANSLSPGMHMLRRAYGPATTTSRRGGPESCIHYSTISPSLLLVARAVGAPADGQRAGRWKKDSNDKADTSEVFGRKLYPKGTRRAYGNVPAEDLADPDWQPPPARGYNDDEDGNDGVRQRNSGYQRRERRLFSSADEDSGEGPSTSGRERRLGNSNEMDFHRDSYSSGNRRFRGGRAGGYGRRDGADGEGSRRRGLEDRGYGGGRGNDHGERGIGGHRVRRGDRNGDRDSLDERRRANDRFEDRWDDGSRRQKGQVRDYEDRDIRDERRERRPAVRGIGVGAATQVDTQADVDTTPSVPVARPPGSNTGNRPLPYDLPIVRVDEGDKGTFFAGSSWRQLGVDEDVASALKGLGFARPSHIQALALSALCDRPGGSSGTSSVSEQQPHRLPPLVLADQAGSGKTLAYLLPLMQALRCEEAAAGTRVTRPKRPRGIVVAPTVELVQQVLRVARALSGAGLRCRTAAFTGGQKDDKARAASFRTQKELLSEGVDLLVATPGRLQQHLERGSLELTDCRMLVMDEADVLMGAQADFASQVAPLRAAAPLSLRFVTVTATLPQHVFAELREVWPGLQTVFGPGLHRTAAGLVEELVDCSGGDEVTEESGRKRKLEALKGLLDRHRALRTIVFCNKIDACRDVENFLARADPQQRKYRVLPYHEAIRDDLRADAMAEFLKPVKPLSLTKGKEQQTQGQGQGQGQPATEAEVMIPGENEQKEGDGEGQAALILVATDRTSRGIDVLYCEHVVLFDFPRDPSEYVRRVGRTARGAGGRGTVSSLVLGRQVPLAREIIDRNQKGMPLHSLPE
ncbi:hypothetical protein VaNZ11_007133, partial [Volvox africanus]